MDVLYGQENQDGVLVYILELELCQFCDLTSVLI
jgi:hypothetical protein